MPTPFYHLSLADQISEHPALDSTLRSFLRENRGAFLLGNTAPDVQVLSGQDRQATHFFSVPIPDGAQVPWQRLLLEYPELGASVDLLRSRLAFIAGYLCHLQADWIWVLDIFQPVFGPQQNWENFSQRLYLHNVLRAYLDLKVIEVLPTEMVTVLTPTQPHRWLPFVQDSLLAEWRDILCDQLQPGERIKTVDVFAARQGVDPDDFHSIIHSEKRMEAEIFKHLSRQGLDLYREALVAENVELLKNYFYHDSFPDFRSANQTQIYNRSVL